MDDDVEIVVVVKHKTGTHTKTESNWRHENICSVLDSLGRYIRNKIDSRSNGVANNRFNPTLDNLELWEEGRWKTNICLA